MGGKPVSSIVAHESMAGAASSIWVSLADEGAVRSDDGRKLLEGGGVRTHEVESGRRQGL